MNLSLLYLTGFESERPEGERLTADLMLDESFRYFFPDTKKLNYFLSVIASPPSDPALPLYRAEILRDFCARPNLLDGLRSALTELSCLRDEQQRERTRCYALVRSTDAESAYVAASAVAQISVDTAKKSLLSLHGLGELLRIYPPQSRGLEGLSERLVSLTSGQTFDELTSLLGLIADLSDEDTFTLRASLNESARVSRYELTGVEKPAPTEETSGLRRLFTKKSSVGAVCGVRIADTWSKLRNELLGGALRELSELAFALSKLIFDEFTPLSRELAFYEAALAYVGAMRAKKLPLCYPGLSADGATYFTELYDLFLCASYPTADAVVPNDADLSSGGIVITGENNSGKTVFLRSVGTAQLLAQAGLPVIARKAAVRMRSGVYHAVRRRGKGIRRGQRRRTI